jgi:hypothetical protein
MYKRRATAAAREKNEMMREKKKRFFLREENGSRRTSANVEPVRIHGRELLEAGGLGVVDVLGQADLAAALQVLGERHHKRLRVHVVH